MQAGVARGRPRAAVQGVEGTGGGAQERAGPKALWPLRPSGPDAPCRAGPAPAPRPRTPASWPPERALLPRPNRPPSLRTQLCASSARGLMSFAAQLPPHRVRCLGCPRSPPLRDPASLAARLDPSRPPWSPNSDSFKTCIRPCLPPAQTPPGVFHHIQEQVKTYGDICHDSSGPVIRPRRPIPC